MSYSGRAQVCRVCVVMTGQPIATFRGIIMWQLQSATFRSVWAAAERNLPPSLRRAALAVACGALTAPQAPASVAKPQRKSKGPATRAEWVAFEAFVRELSPRVSVLRALPIFAQNTLSQT